MHLGNVDDIQAQAAEVRNDSPSASLPMPISGSVPVAHPRIVDDDVEANWSGEGTPQASEDRTTSLSGSLRDLSSTVSTVVWRGFEAVRNTTGFPRRPPDGIDRDR
jgi:hypothetical protein